MRTAVLDERVNLTGVALDRAQLAGANFHGAVNLDRADLEGAT